MLVLILFYSNLSNISPALRRFDDVIYVTILLFLFRMKDARTDNWAASHTELALV